MAQAVVHEGIFVGRGSLLTLPGRKPAWWPMWCIVPVFICFRCTGAWARTYQNRSRRMR